MTSPPLPHLSLAPLAAGLRSAAARLAQAPGERARAAARRRSRRCPACRRCADPANLYSETTAGKLSPAVAGDLPRVYVPNLQSNDVYVIDPATLKVVDKFKVGAQSAARRAVVGPEDAVGGQQRRGHDRRQPDADRPEDRQAGQGDPGRRSVQHVLHARRQVGDRRRRGAQAARLPRPADDGAAVLARRAAVRAASTTPTSRSTAATRSSPASSRAPSPRSTSSTARCWATRR